MPLWHFYVPDGPNKLMPVHIFAILCTLIWYILSLLEQ